MKRHFRTHALLLAVLIAGATQLGYAQEAEPPAGDSSQVEPTDGSKLQARYDDGLDFSTVDGNWRAHLEGRVQFRFWYPFDTNVDAINDYEDLIQTPASATFEVRRARLRWSGNFYRPWIKYFVQYDFIGARLLNTFVAFEKYDGAQFKLGQFRAPYSREFRESSRRLQLVGRSVVNDYFTLDWQVGLQVDGRLFAGSAGDSRYYVGVFNGDGRGEPNDDTHFMWMARYQWNFLGRDLALGQGDHEIRDLPAASLAVAAVTNRSRCTAFSTSGCAQLPGFEDGESGQYTIGQIMGELAYKHRGFSTQGEIHWKRIDDNVNSTLTKLVGGYAQFGYLPHAAIPSFPRPLEFAVRFATVDPDRELGGNSFREFTFGVNWYFAGYRNRLTADASLLDSDEVGSRGRVRIQWDVTF